MSNPFERDDELYVVLLNKEGQYSLWPAFLDIPLGWEISYREDTREKCLAYINEEWTDMRPLSLKGSLASGVLK